MKTKNIFRMLLVAAALLMGANNVKAAVDLPFSNSDGENRVEIKYGAFNNVSTSDFLRVTYIITDWGNQWYVPNYAIEIGSKNGSISKDLKSIAQSQTSIDVRISEFSSVINTEDGNNCSLYVQGTALNITNIQLITNGSGTETPTTYSITIDNTIQHGTVSVSGNKTTGLEANETVTLVATPDTNYELGGWNVKDANNNVITVTNNQFSMPASNVTVSATFTQTSQQPQQTETVTATISSSTGYATFSNSSALNFSGVNGMKAYIATAVSNNLVTLTQVTGAVAANTGLVIIGNNGNSGPFNIPKVTSGTSYDNNLLVAGNGYTLELSTSYTDYVLIEDTDGQAKFAEVWNPSALPPIAIGKAYLHVPAANGARIRNLSIIISDGTTGINAVENEQGESVIYNLRGQRVENPTKGLYIINGKKVLIK